jgi:hypothetical protein
LQGFQLFRVEHYITLGFNLVALENFGSPHRLLVARADEGLVDTADRTNRRRF